MDKSPEKRALPPGYDPAIHNVVVIDKHLVGKALLGDGQTVDVNIERPHPACLAAAASGRV